MQLVSQDKLTVMPYQGVRTVTYKDDVYGVIAFNGYSQDILIGKYNDLRRVQRIIEEIRYAAVNDKDSYYMPQ